MSDYAGFWKRFIANMIDSLILIVASGLLSWLTRDLYIAFGMGVILGLIYYPVFESSVLLGTPGKALMSIAVVSEMTGEKITFKSAVVRFFCRYISMVILYIGYLMQPFTKKRQTLHDMLSETVVINKVSTEDINYFTAWKNQFKDIVAKL
jgi:eukaryotic-like serine/threonine-protein kinase